MKLILLPGMDGTGLLFEPLLQVLPPSLDIQVIAYPSDGDQSYKTIIGYVESQLPRDEDFILLAESFAGPIAYNIALKNQYKLKHIIFVASFIQAPSFSAKYLSQFFPVALLSEKAIPKFIIKRMLLGNYVDNELIRLFWESVNRVGPHTLKKRMAAIRVLPPAMQKVQVPCTYIQATKDQLVSVSSIKPIKACFSQIKEYSIAGPHFILQAQPKACADIIASEVAKST